MKRAKSMKMKNRLFFILSSLTIIVFLLVIAGCSTEEYMKEKQEKRTQGENSQEEPIQEQTGKVPEENKEEDTGKETEEKTEEQNIEKEGSGKLLIFHNGQGPMCLQALEFFEAVEKEYPDFEYKEYLTTTGAGRNKLIGMEQEYRYSQGVSSSFGYLPIIFINEKAYSGFTTQIGEDIEKDIKEVFG